MAYKNGNLLVEIGGASDRTDDTFVVSTSEQLYLTDVELTVDRDNTIRYGVSSTEPEQVLQGNESYTISVESDVSDATAALLNKLYTNNGRPSGFFEESDDTDTDPFVITFDEMVWNSWSVSRGEDDDVTSITFEADLAGVSLGDQTANSVSDTTS